MVTNETDKQRLEESADKIVKRTMRMDMVWEVSVRQMLLYTSLYYMTC